jgi:A/G-specific adenine glycosylase
MKNSFAKRLLKWFHKSGRHDLPWQKNPTPYRVWVSEIMLQQTQVSTVIPYYRNFVKAFPNVKNLANAESDYVLHLWSGLGYYARARNLHKAAVYIMQKYNGRFPTDIEDVIQLPGIGRSTAAAILSLSKGQRQPILDGNVKRVLTRHQGVSGWPGNKQVEEKLWKLADKLTPEKHVSEYTQAIMDLGAMVCTHTRPACTVCPVKVDCYSFNNNQQSMYPTTKPKKSIPVKETIFTIINNRRGEILLVKRPPTGIWGGLWSFPECAVDVDVKNWIESQFGTRVESLKNGKSLRHTFSHFHLDIHPVQVTLNSNSCMIKDTGGIYWYNPDDNLNKGIAAPVAKLLQNISVA